jgi:hypothetical protein
VFSLAAVTRECRVSSAINSPSIQIPAPASCQHLNKPAMRVPIDA